MSRRVTVHGYEGRTAKLIALDEGPRLVYVAAPGSLNRIADGSTEPVGVPKEDVREGWNEEAAH